MSDSPPIPPEVWQRIVEFLRAADRRYGRIELDVQDGRIIQLRLIESVRVHADRVGECHDLAS